MKSTIKATKAITEIEYPKLMIGNVSDIVVIMSGESCGTVLNVGNGVDWSVGDYRTTWDMNKFKPFDGQIVLEN